VSAPGEKIIVLEILATEVIVTVKTLSKGELPKPSQYIASMVMFGVLGGAAAINPSMARIAAYLGGVVLLTTIVLDPSDTVGKLFNIAGGTGNEGNRERQAARTDNPQGFAGGGASGSF
jgi:hypothetical protein